MYYLKTESSFDSAHFLKGYAGKCRNLHGHRWRVVVEIAADQLKDEGQTRGMLVDFSDLKNALKDICDDFDHSLIYEKGSLKGATIAALQAGYGEQIITLYIACGSIIFSEIPICCGVRGPVGKQRNGAVY